jgi:hypothetical protein
MSLEFDATYRDGAIHPAVPLGLPENTPVHVTVAPASPNAPPSPRLTVEEFDALFQQRQFSAPPLPDDFSRADVYCDHD